MNENERKILVEWMGEITLHLAGFEQDYWHSQGEKFNINVNTDPPYNELQQLTARLRDEGEG